MDSGLVPVEFPMVFQVGSSVFQWYQWVPVVPVSSSDQHFLEFKILGTGKKLGANL